MRRALGVTMMVPAAAARQHVERLRAGPYYMTFNRISDLAGVSVSIVAQLASGHRHPARGCSSVDEVHRDTEAALLGVRPEVATKTAGKSGAKISPVGVQRRLQALLRVGFPMSVLTIECGMRSSGNTIFRLVSGGRSHVYASTHQRIAAVYDRLVPLGPEGYGLDPTYTIRSVNSARRHGYAPPGAWDADTIDDPDALPEWTGACGTEPGYQIHYREKLPYCQPCRDAHHAYKLEHPGKSPLKSQRWAEIWRLADEQGMTVDQIAKWLDVSERTVTRALKEERA